MARAIAGIDRRGGRHRGVYRRVACISRIADAQSIEWKHHAQLSEYVTDVRAAQ